MERLRFQAAKAGGGFYAMNGNHEIINTVGRFSYVTKGGFNDFYRWEYWYKYGQRWKRQCGLHAPPLNRTLHPEIVDPNLPSRHGMHLKVALVPA